MADRAQFGVGNAESGNRDVWGRSASGNTTGLQPVIGSSTLPVSTKFEAIMDLPRRQLWCDECGALIEVGGTLANPPSPRGEMRMENKTFSDSSGVSGQLQWPNPMSPEAYLDFLHELAGLRIRVRRAVPKESQAEVQFKDEEAAKEEAQERMERSS
jgi:hypothetical protein